MPLISGAFTQLLGVPSLLRAIMLKHTMFSILLLPSTLQSLRRHKNHIYHGPFHRAQLCVSTACHTASHHLTITNTEILRRLNIAIEKHGTTPRQETINNQDTFSVIFG